MKLKSQEAEHIWTQYLIIVIAFIIIISRLVVKIPRAKNEAKIKSWNG